MPRLPRWLRRPILLCSLWAGACAGVAAPVAGSGAAGAGGGIFELAHEPVAETPLDRLVITRQREAGVRAAAPCSDAVFLRRVFFDVIGTPPTAEEAARFLDDPRPDKRRHLVEQVLERPEYAEFWAMRWGDVLRVKAEFPINLWPNAAQVYHRWLVQALRENRPMDAWARELLTASGSNFRSGPANFYRAMQGRDAETAARAVALAFWGMRAERWEPERLAGLAAFFSGLRYKPTGEWKEEIVLFDLAAAGDPAHPPVFPDGRRATIRPGEDARAILADWMLRPEDPWLARATVNRAWAWLFGRGIVHEPDDLGPHNPPANPALLAHLEREFIAARYDLKRLMRLILNSRTYQRSSLPADPGPLSAEHFAHYAARRLEAEVLADAINQITGGTDSYVSAIPEPFTYIPADLRAISLPDGSITGGFLEKFGRSPRDTGLMSERDNSIRAAQRLHLLNSGQILRKLEQGPEARRLSRADTRAGGGAGRTERIYLAILSRRPTAEERARFAGVPAGDLAWALINTSEFMLRH